MSDDLQDWMRKLVDAAVRGVDEQEIFADPLIEAKPAWALPYRILVGKIREQQNPRAFQWFICGEVPLDFLPSEVATTPREALRHFAMKWQLAAERANEKEHADTLIDDAEAIYELADADNFWQP